MFSQKRVVIVRVEILSNSEITADVAAFECAVALATSSDLAKSGMREELLLKLCSVHPDIALEIEKFRRDNQ